MDSSAIPADADSTLAATLPDGTQDNLPLVLSYVFVAFAFGINAIHPVFTLPESLVFFSILYVVITVPLTAGPVWRVFTAEDDPAPGWSAFTQQQHYFSHAMAWDRLELLTDA